MVHGDIRPKYISFEPEAETFKLSDRLGDPTPPNQVQINNYRNNDNLYVSPLIFEAIIQEKQKLKHNPYKSDIFSLGLIILEVGLGKNIQQIYDLENQCFDQNALNDLIDEFNDKFNDDQTISDVLQMILKIKEKDRFDAKNIYQMLGLDEYEEMYEKAEQEELDNNSQNYDDQKLEEEVVEV